MRSFIFFIAGLILLVALVGTLPPQLNASEARNPVEVGDIHWRRDFKEVMAESQNSGTPVFLLFQEVPG